MLGLTVPPLILAVPTSRLNEASPLHRAVLSCRMEQPITGARDDRPFWIALKTCSSC
jgi:hypothetical protein